MCIELQCGGKKRLFGFWNLTDVLFLLGEDWISWWDSLLRILHISIRCCFTRSVWCTTYLGVMRLHQLHPTCTCSALELQNIHLLFWLAFFLCSCVTVDVSNEKCLPPHRSVSPSFRPSCRPHKPDMESRAPATCLPLSLLIKRPALGVFYVVWVWPLRLSPSVWNPPPAGAGWREESRVPPHSSAVCAPFHRSSDCLIPQRLFSLNLRGWMCRSPVRISTVTFEKLRCPEWSKRIASGDIWLLFFQCCHTTLKSVCHVLWSFRCTRKPFRWWNLTDPPTLWSK